MMNNVNLKIVNVLPKCIVVVALVRKNVHIDNGKKYIFTIC